MKKGFVLFALGLVLAAGCRTESDPLPSESWSNGCAELVPDHGAYRLSGLCCEQLTFPFITSVRQGSFTVKGTCSSFTGAGVASTPVTVKGTFSRSDTTLTLQYTVHSQPVTFRLKPGRAIMHCDCYCD